MKLSLSLFTILAAVSSCCTDSGKLPRAGADRAVERAVDSFIAATEAAANNQDSIEVHSVMILSHGKVIAERWLNGATPDSAHIMHSVSKTLTAIAAGLAFDEEMLSPDEKVVDIFL